MTMKIAHVLLTRFNLPSPGAESLIRAQEGWLRDRVALFEKYCIPSVRAQTVKDFSWIIYFDPESPEWLKSSIRSWSSDGVITPIFREQVSREDLVNDLRLVTKRSSQYLMTTNLDNDDSLASDFVERLQAVQVDAIPQAIYLSQGLILKGESLYLHRDEHNAFCSVIEEWENPVTCWVDWHNRLADHMSTSTINGTPGWMQVVHGRNVSNRVHGKRIGPGPYSGIFGELLLDASAPRLPDLLLEKCWNVPRRRTYEFMRRTVKDATLRVGGKTALDRVKNILQRVRKFT